MKQLTQAATDEEAWAEQFAASLEAHRHSFLGFIADEQRRLVLAEACIAEELERLHQEVATQHEQIDRLRAERDALSEELADRESAGADGREGSSGEQLREDYERTLHELRQAVNQNADLQDQVARARSTASKSTQQAWQPGALNWETEKQRILLALENDFDEDDEPQQRERLKIAEVVRSTTETVAQKDGEIQELREQLQASAAHNGAPDATVCVSVDATFEMDAVIREERERLKTLQDQWSEKLREAEVELALERAKLARQRAELDERVRKNSEADGAATATEPNRRTPPTIRGRWLARLGLTDADREPRRKNGQ